MLRQADLHLPKTGWGRIVLAAWHRGPGGPGPTRAPPARNIAFQTEAILSSQAASLARLDSLDALRA